MDMCADYSIELIFNDTCAPKFNGHNNSFLASVFIFHKKEINQPKSYFILLLFLVFTQYSIVNMANDTLISEIFEYEDNFVHNESGKPEQFNRGCLSPISDMGFQFWGIWVAQSNKGKFKYYVIKEVGGWGQKMAIFDDLQYCRSSKRWVGLKKLKT